MRNWRFQPTARSAAMRAPHESIELIVPNATNPTMKYIGAEMPVPSRLCTLRLGARDQEVQDQREPKREDEEPSVAQRAQQLIAGVGAALTTAPRPAVLAAPSPVSCKNASSRPAAAISMSRASGCVASSARMAASESAHASTIASPRRSAPLTPGSRRECVEVGARQRRANRSLADHRLDLGRRPIGDNLPMGHQHRPIGICVGLLQVVGGKQDRPAARRLSSHRRPEGAPSLDIHRDRRLVEHEQLRVADKRHSETHPLRLPAGELLRALPGDLASGRSAPASLPHPAARDTARPPSRSALPPRGRESTLLFAASRRSSPRRSPRSESRQAPTPCPRRARPSRGSCRSSWTCRRRWVPAARPSRRRRSRCRCRARPVSTHSSCAGRWPQSRSSIAFFTVSAARHGQTWIWTNDRRTSSRARNQL